MPVSSLSADAGSLRLSGELRMNDAAHIWHELRRLTETVSGPALDLDLSGVVVLDGGIMSLLIELRAELAARGVRSELVGGSPSVRSLVRLYHGDEPARAIQPAPRMGTIEELGRAIAAGWRKFYTLVVFVGELVGALASMLREPRRANLSAVPAFAAQAGTDAIPIVLLLNFLVGFVIAFQSARQLANYGANIYVADLIGISVTREMGPLVTALIICGRSGTAYAAELGTMRVSEEIDALRTMGFAPIPYLIFPRVVALVLIAPCLTLLGDLVGVAGGMVVGVMNLGVAPGNFLSQLKKTVSTADIWTGLIKSVVYATTIALIGCEEGFAARGAATGVGRATTKTVVLCLFSIVIIDALFTVLFRVLSI